MISGFGCTTEPEPGVIHLAANMVRGNPLTLLRPDGLGKAGTGRDKIMVGPSSGWPTGARRHRMTCSDFADD